MANSSNLPRILIKRALEKIITSELNIKLVDQFKVGNKRDVQAWIINMTEEYERVQLNSRTLRANLSITIDFFSEINETGVHQAIMDLIRVGPEHNLLKEFRISLIAPSSSETQYNTEATEGAVMARVVLQINYLMKD